MHPEKISFVKFIGVMPTRDISVDDPSHRFYSDGIAVSNSAHASAYSAVSCAELWLKYYFYEQYMCTLLNYVKRDKKIHGKNAFRSYMYEIREKGVLILPPDINKSGSGFKLEEQEPGKWAIRFGFNKIKGIGEKAIAPIVEGQPYTDLADFHERTPGRLVNKRVVEALIFSGAFDCWGSRNEVRNSYFADVRKDKKYTPTEISDTELENKEIDALDIALSKKTIKEEYSEYLSQDGVVPLGDAGLYNKAMIVGRLIGSIKRNSKKGNPMLVLDFTDDIDTVRVYVWQNQIEELEGMMKGAVYRFPVKKIDPDGDSDGLCYNSYRGKERKKLEGAKDNG